MTISSRGTPALILFLVACGTEGGTDSGFDLSTWITEADVKFGDFAGTDVVFSRPAVRAVPTRNRILVLDPGNSQVSGWTTEGELQFVVGRSGQGPGEFTGPQALVVEADGSFGVVSGSGSRFTYFDADGNLLTTMLGPGTGLGYQGFRIEFGWPKDDVLVGVPSIPPRIMTGKAGVRPMDQIPLLGIRRSQDGVWQAPQPLLTLDYRNLIQATPTPRGSWAWGTQRFHDADMLRFTPGGAIVMRQKEAPGSVELIEVTGDGDTLWHRRLQFEPRRLTPRMIEEELDRIVEAFGPHFGAPLPRLRALYRESMYKPEHLAIAQRPFVTASDEVWLKARATDSGDTLVAHYVVRRGNSNEKPRRVLVPESVEINDATETHVWGVWWDELDVPHIVGRRLVPVGKGE